MHCTGSDYDAACATKIEIAAQQLSAATLLSDDEMQALAKKYIFNTPAYTQALKEAKARRANAALAGLNTDCAKVLAARRGFTLDLAGGGAWRFADAKVSRENGEFLMAGAWISGGYTWSNRTVLGMGRFLRRAVDITQRQSVGDLGLRGIYAASRFSGSLEGIYRHRFSGDGASNTYRLGFTIEYRATDTSWLSVTFGRDFTDVTDGTLFSLANLGWGFGDRKIKNSAQ